MFGKILAGGVGSLAFIVVFCVGLAFESLIPAAVITLLTSIGFVSALVLCVGVQIGVFLLIVLAGAGIALAFSD